MNSERVMMLGEAERFYRDLGRKDGFGLWSQTNLRKNELGEPPTGAIDYDAYCFLTSHVVHGTIKGISDRSAVNE